MTTTSAAQQSSRISAPLSALLLASSVCVASGFMGTAGNVGRGSVAFAASTAPVSRWLAPRHQPRQQQQSWSPTSLSMAQRRGRPKGPVRTIIEKPPMNEEIEFDELRVTTLNTEGGKDETLGVMSKADALAKAKELGVDLILINSGSDPPVAKIADYSKYRYMQEKKSKEKKKNAKSSELKEVKMSYKIDVHDYQVRKKNASKFISQGNRVKCTVMFRGREIQHDNLGVDLLNKLAEDMSDLANMEGKPKREGRNLSCFLVPRADVLKSINDGKRAAEKAKKAKKEKRKEKVAAKKGAAAAAAAAGAVAVAEPDLSSLDLTDEDDDDASLDELLGGDDLTDDLFG